jgi:MFS family permease
MSDARSRNGPFSRWIATARGAQWTSTMNLGHALRNMRTALREEPAARRYLLANLVDDVGVAVSVWAIQILQTDMMKDQHARASIALPVLVVMIVGTLAAGPLADYARRWSVDALPKWRRDVLLVARVVETLALGALVALIASGPLTIARVLPYALVSGFLKTALRPTRLALAVDVLEREAPEEGLDEHGAPRTRKANLPAFAALTSQLSSAAVLAGLLLGGRLMSAAHGRAWILFAFDVLTNVGYLAILATVPILAPKVRIRTLVTLQEKAPRFAVVRFVFAKPQRWLLAILGGAWVIEFMDELYDGRMIVRHVLGGSAESVRFAEIAWTLASLVAVGALPALLKRVPLRVAFTTAMLVDGAIMSLAGTVVIRGGLAAIAPFALLIGADRALTALSGTMAQLAQASATSASMRGRLNGTWQLWVIVTCIVAEGAATAASDAWGIGPMIRFVGVAQIVAVAILALVAYDARVTTKAAA